MAAGRITQAGGPRVGVPCLHNTNELKVSYENTMLRMTDRYVLLVVCFLLGISPASEF